MPPPKPRSGARESRRRVPWSANERRAPGSPWAALGWAHAARSKARVVRGRGIAVGTHLSSYGAAVAEIEVDRNTGVIAAKRMYGAIEAGQIVNPGFVENQTTGMLVPAGRRKP